MTLDDMDKLAAEKVMGWHKIRVGERYDWQIGYDETYGSPYTIMQNHWRPTRNIAQAWECLEKINWLPSLDGYRDRWEVLLQIGDAIEKGVAATAPEAIVRACLKAKGVQIE